MKKISRIVKTLESHGTSGTDIVSPMLILPDVCKDRKIKITIEVVE